MNKLLVMIFLLNMVPVANGYGQREINVDFSNEIATIKDLLGVNRDPGGMNRDPGEKILGYQETGITTIRLHDDRFNDYQYYSEFWQLDTGSNSFSILNTDFDPTNSAHYHWDTFDLKLSTIIDHNFEVYFRLGISWPNNPLYPTPPLQPPLDPDGAHFTKFAELCKRTVMHCNDGWDDGFDYNFQYWEIWNEPGGIFWDGTPMQFYQMYEAVSRALKAYNPELKVGAPGAVPATIVIPQKAYFHNFLQYLSDNHAPLDFYSWHLYGAKNPYGIKYWADYVRDVLDSLGFVDAESHITEINCDLHETGVVMEDNALGAAYLLSNLITAQEAPVDKMFWYPGLQLVDSDSLNAPRLKWNAYGMKTFSLTFENTPVQIHATGSDVVEGHWQADTTNFMVLAAKSKDANKLYLAISNYKSNYQDYEIHFNHLPWDSDDTIKVTKNFVKERSDKFSEHVSYMAGGSTLDITINDMPSPSITFIRLERQTSTGIRQGSTTPKFFHMDQNYPNPFNPSTTIRFYLPQDTHVALKVFDVTGREVATLVEGEMAAGNHEVTFEPQDVTNGLYFYQLTAGKLNQTKKLIFIK